MIGGAQLFALAEPHASRIEVIKIDADYEGDAFAQGIGPEWRETSPQANTAPNGLQYAFVNYVRAVTPG